MEIILQNDQPEHVERLRTILTITYGAFDFSVMGSGKTFTSSKLSLLLGFENVIVVCPVSVEEKWLGMSKYGVKIRNVISYQSLRSRTGSQPKHGLLSRIDPEEGSTIFLPTEKLLQMIQEGCLVIFDEAQNIKNKNDQWLCCKAISTAILKNGGKSRFLLLSGTPIDKEEHAINLMSMMGFIRHPKLYNYNKEENSLKLFGAQELLNYCLSLEPEKTKQFLRVHRFQRDNVHHLCYLLFQNVLKPRITSSMNPPKIEVNIDCKNGYYNILDEEDCDNLLRGIRSLCLITKHSEEREAEFTSENMGAITKCLMKIEKSKVSTFHRIGKYYLEKNPNCKIGIFMNYSEHIEDLKELFIEYNPLVINGKTPKDKRQKIIDLYQKPDTEYRVIIGNLQVCCSGIDLNDCSPDGRFPRYAFASPNYVILNLHQLTRRFLRMNSTSNAVFRFVYGKVDGRKETSILNSLAKKSSIMEDTLDKQVEQGIKFPGQYEEDIEEDL